MKNNPLWSPWRLEYVQNPKEDGPTCAFCRILGEKEDGKTNLILERNTHSYIVLNRYPYNNGHLMVVPHQHGGNLLELSPEAMGEMALSIQRCIRILDVAYKPDAYNTGLNQGKDAGAGITEHLHWHIVPRWRGDTNFMPVMSETKALPQHLFDSYNYLKEIVDSL